MLFLVGEDSVPPHPGSFGRGLLSLPAPDNNDNDGKDNKGNAADIARGGRTDEGIAAVGGQRLPRPDDGIDAAVPDGGRPDALCPPRQIRKQHAPNDQKQHMARMPR